MSKKHTYSDADLDCISRTIDDIRNCAWKIRCHDDDLTHRQNADNAVSRDNIIHDCYRLFRIMDVNTPSENESGSTERRGKFSVLPASPGNDGGDAA